MFEVRRQVVRRDPPSPRLQGTTEDVPFFKLLFTSTLISFAHIPPTSDKNRGDDIVFEAKLALHPSTHPLDIKLGLFVSASCLDGPELKGAYSVVFRELSPGKSQHGKLLKMAWNMPFVTDQNSAHGLAIAQAINIVGQRLRAFPIGPDGGLETVKVGIFTDNIPCLRDIITPARTEGPGRVVRKSVTSLVREELEKISGIPNMRVELVLNWLKTNSGVKGQNEAGKLAEKCRKQGRNIFFVDEEERPSAEMDKSVAKMIADTLLPERLRIIKELRAKGLAPPRAATIPSMDDSATCDDFTASPASSSMPPQASNPEYYEDGQESDDLSPAADDQHGTTNGDEQAGNDEASEPHLTEQKLVDRQLNIEDLEYHVRFYWERSLPGRSTRGTQERYEARAKWYASELDDLVPGHPLYRLVHPRSPELDAILSWL